MSSVLVCDDRSLRVLFLVAGAGVPGVRAVGVESCLAGVSVVGDRRAATLVCSFRWVGEFLGVGLYGRMVWPAGLLAVVFIVVSVFVPYV